MQAINEGLPPELRERYEALTERRREGTLTAEEHGELLRSSDEVEVIEARRAAHLVELSRLRGVSLPALMDSLGIRSPEYG